MNSGTNRHYIGLIPARGGSKRLPGKNKRLLCGLPMMAYSIRASLACGKIECTVVSTDSEDLREIGLAEGCFSIPLRPASLAADDTDSLTVLRFELPRLRNLLGPIDYIVLLQPTSPLRTSRDVEAAIEQFENSGADTLTSITQTTDPTREFWIEEDGWIKLCNRPQIVDSRNSGELWRENGAIYILSASLLDAGRFYGERITGYKLAPHKNIDVDTLADFTAAEAAMALRDPKA
jgi:CMP-N,N'-diacetyllegionaminic acid synthase